MSIRYTPSLAMQRGLLEERARKPVAVVVHTTGHGPVTRATALRFAWWRKRHEIGKGDAFACAEFIYTRIMKASPHYIVGQRGEVLQLVPLDYVAWHVGGKGSEAYKRTDWNAPAAWRKGSKDVGWWRERWPKLKSPYGLAGGALWGGGSCNAGSYGIDVIPPIDDVRGPWTPACVAALCELVSSLCEQSGIPFTREHIITHSDAHPLPRSAKGQPWDPGPRQWQPERLGLGPEGAGRY
jgi:hypothetical protein